MEVPILPNIPFDGGVRIVSRIGPAGVFGVWLKAKGEIVC